MELNTTTNSFVFKMVEPAKNTGLKRFHESASMIGKHYTFVPLFDNVPVRENKNRVLRRHYTIANCMQKDFYKSLVSAVSGRGQFDSSLLKHTDTYEVYVGIKNYGLRQGVARRIFSDNGQLFLVKGPMGKGLGLTNHSTGTHVAFVGGTGVFVFVDLVARLALGLLGLLPTDQQFGPDFRFELFASFASRNEAIALDLLEGVMKLCKSKGNGQFQLVTRFSDEKSARWDSKYIEQQLPKKVTRVWVCGPPAMNENFEHIMRGQCRRLEMDFTTQVELM